jgi:hypothetical protein
MEQLLLWPQVVAVVAVVVTIAQVSQQNPHIQTVDIIMAHKDRTNPVTVAEQVEVVVATMAEQVEQHLAEMMAHIAVVMVLI